MSNDEWGSLLRLIANEDHMKKNIADVKKCQATSKVVKNGAFMHYVEIEIIVKTEFLWESPRAYIWKHVGGPESWERGNGSSIKLIKIHQK